jgi:SRSO17 transposase
VNTILNERVDLFKEYIDSFDTLWSREKQKEYFEKSLKGFNSEIKRKNIERISENIIDQDYQNLHHFITTSPWDRKEMNEIRINFMQEHSNSYPTKKAMLVIDDSGVLKRGKATEGVGYQYIGQVGKVANGNVFVTSHLVSESKHIPLDIKEFIPEDKTKTKEEQKFTTKIEIAIFLIEEAIRRGIKFEFVVADAWYGSSPNFTDYLESKGLKYIVAIKSNRNIFYKFPNDLKSSEHKISELLTLIEPDAFRPLDINLSDGSIKKIFFVRMDLKVKGLSGKRRVIIETDRIEDWENAEVSYFISNATELRDDTVIRYYHRRNWIEVFYREVKNFLGADDYQVRSMDRILRHWTLCIVTYSMMQWLQHGKAIKEFVKKND